jgi:hypothetical protein
MSPLRSRYQVCPAKCIPSSRNKELRIQRRNIRRALSPEWLPASYPTEESEAITLSVGTMTKSALPVRAVPDPEGSTRARKSIERPPKGPIGKLVFAFQ